MNGWQQFFMFLLTTAFIQNLVLSTGFGTSIMLRIVRRPRDIGVYALLLTLFSVLTICVTYPLDMWIGTGSTAKLLRPLMIVAVAALLYLLAALVVSKIWPTLYRRISRLLPLAAFNNLVIGVALVVNHQFSISLLGALGLAIGSCIGFVLLLGVTAEGMERIDNPDMPQAFRGLPATLIYLGILALALLGFNNQFILI